MRKCDIQLRPEFKKVKCKFFFKESDFVLSLTFTFLDGVPLSFNLVGASWPDFQ